MSGRVRHSIVANRGEIAVPGHPHLRRHGHPFVRFSEADAGAATWREGRRRAVLGPAPATRQSYLNIPAHGRGRAVRTGAQVRIPGYGFLSRTPSSPVRWRRAGIVSSARRRGHRHDGRQDHRQGATPEPVPVCRWCRVSRGPTERRRPDRGAAEVGYPVLVKPSAGGGGKGMRMVTEPGRLGRPRSSAPRIRGGLSATTHCSSNDSCCGPGISRSRSSPTRTAACAPR